MKQSKLYVAALAALSAFCLTPPALAQLDMDGQEGLPGDDIAINVPFGPEGAPEFTPPPPPGDGPMFVGAQFPPPPEMMAAMHKMRMMHSGCPGGWHHGKCSPFDMLTGDNALTDEQYEKMYELKNKTMDQVAPKMVEMMTASRHLKDLLTQETIDDKAVKRLENQISAVRSDVEGIKLGSQVAMMQILTPAQRKALRQAMVRGPRGMRPERKWHDKRKETSEQGGNEPL